MTPATHRYKTALIGCGAIHEAHADALKDSSFAELRTVVDIDEERAARSAAHYGCGYALDYHEVLKDPEIEVVHLCTPHYLHAPMTVDALRAGKHVLTEKPMGISVEQCEAMVRASEETGRQLGVCFQNRYNSTYLALRELVRLDALPHDAAHPHPGIERRLRILEHDLRVAHHLAALARAQIG